MTINNIIRVELLKLFSTIWHAISLALICLVFGISFSTLIFYVMKIDELVGQEIFFRYHRKHNSLFQAENELKSEFYNIYHYPLDKISHIGFTYFLVSLKFNYHKTQGIVWVRAKAEVSARGSFILQYIFTSLNAMIGMHFSDCQINN